MIHYATPYSLVGDVGQAYNEFMRLLPNDDDFAGLLDGDAMFSTHHFGHHIAECVRANPDCGYFCCCANRLNSKWQTVGQAAFVSDSLKYHRQLGTQFWDRHGAECVDVADRTPRAAGVLMVVRKSEWRRVGGFTETTNPDKPNLLSVDADYHRAFVRHGLPIKMMLGVYVIHWFRGAQSMGPFKGPTGHLTEHYQAD